MPGRAHIPGRRVPDGLEKRLIYTRAAISLPITTGVLVVVALRYCYDGDRFTWRFSEEEGPRAHSGKTPKRRLVYAASYRRVFFFSAGEKFRIILSRRPDDAGIVRRPAFSAILRRRRRRRSLAGPVRSRTGRRRPEELATLCRTIKRSYFFFFFQHANRNRV